MPTSSTAETNRILRIMQQAILADVQTDKPDLTTRQLTVLLTTYLDEGPHTVRAVAARMKVSKPAVSRAIDRLEEFTFVTRQPDPMDRRSILIQLTDQGKTYIKGYKANIATAAKRYDEN